MRDPGSRIQPISHLYAKFNRFRRRRIDHSRNYTRHQKSEDRDPGGNVNKEAGIAGISFRQHVVENPKRPSESNEENRQSLQSLRNRAVIFR